MHRLLARLQHPGVRIDEAKLRRKPLSPSSIEAVRIEGEEVEILGDAVAEVPGESGSPASRKPSKSTAGLNRAAAAAAAGRTPGREMDGAISSTTIERTRWMDRVAAIRGDHATAGTRDSKVGLPGRWQSAELRRARNNR